MVIITSMLGLVFLPLWLFSGNQIDSLRNELKQSKSEIERFDLCTELTNAYFRLNPDSAIHYGKKALDLAIISNNDHFLMKAYSNLGTGYFYKNDYENAYNNYLLLLKLAEKLPDSTNQLKAYNGMAITFIGFKNYSAAMDYQKKALKIALKQKNILGIGISYQNMGVIYVHREKYEEALAKYDTALMYLSKLDDATRLSDLLNNIGAIYSDHKKNEKTAIQYFEQALNISLAENNNTTTILLYSNLACSYFNLGNYQKCLEYILKAKKLNRIVKDPLHEAEIYRYLGLIKLVENNPREANEYLNNYKSILDSVWSNKLSEKIAMEQVKYDTYKKVSQIEQLNIEKAHKENQMGILLLGILISSLLTTIVIILYRSKNNAYKILLERNLEILRTQKPIDIRKEAFKLPDDDGPDPSDIITEDPKDDGPDHEIHHLSDHIKENIYNELKHKLEKEFIYRNSNLTLYKVARSINTNTTYVSRVINEKFGDSFKNVINKYRIEEAMQILADKKLYGRSIEEIAYHVGFNSHQVFNKSFKKITGLTPSYFKRSLASRNNEHNKLV